jgi:hypothetical protein
MGFSFFLKRRKKRLFSATPADVSTRRPIPRGPFSRFPNARDPIDGTV